MLLFHEEGCSRVDKETYLTNHIRTISDSNYQNRIRWAVSGYPLILNSKKVSSEMTAITVSDYRHLWQLPQLNISLMKKLRKLSSLPPGNKIEFYFGFEQLQDDRYFVQATTGNSVTMPLEIIMPEYVIDIGRSRYAAVITVPLSSLSPYALLSPS